MIISEHSFNKRKQGLVKFNQVYKSTICFLNKRSIQITQDLNQLILLVIQTVFDKHQKTLSKQFDKIFSH